MGVEAKNARWDRWDTCSLCEQRYHGVVKCALGWACWKTYLGLPETHQTFSVAMGLLGNALGSASRHEERLGVLEALWSVYMRRGAPQDHLLAVRANIAVCHGRLGREEQALEMRREIYATSIEIGQAGDVIFRHALNLTKSLIDAKRYAEVQSFLSEQIPKARRALGVHDEIFLRLRLNYATSLSDGAAARDDLVKAKTLQVELSSTIRRVFGPSHPLTIHAHGDLAITQSRLASCDAPG